MALMGHGFFPNKKYFVLIRISCKNEIYDTHKNENKAINRIQNGT